MLVLIKFIFQAQTPMELSLVKGEMVTLTRRIDGNWLVCHNIKVLMKCYCFRTKL